MFMFWNWVNVIRFGLIKVRTAWAAASHYVLLCSEISSFTSQGHSRTRELDTMELLEHLPALQQLLHRLMGCQVLLLLTPTLYSMTWRTLLIYDLLKMAVSAGYSWMLFQSLVLRFPSVGFCNLINEQMLKGRVCNLCCFKHLTYDSCISRFVCSLKELP